MALGARCMAAVPGSRGPGPASGPLAAASRGRGAGPGRPVCRGQPAQRAASVRSCGADRLGAPALLARAPGRAGRQGLSGVPGPAQAAAGLVVRDVPGLLCDPAYAPGYPAPAESGLVAAARARYGVSIGDLVGAGLLRRERSSSAQVTKAMPPPVPAPPRDRRRKMPELTRVAHCARSGGDSDRDSLDGAPAAASDRLGGPSRQLVGSGGRRG